MTSGWRRLANLLVSLSPGRQPEKRVTEPPKEPTFEKPPREPGAERMEFQLSMRRRGISSREVLRAMDVVPREQFVLPDYVETAYADQAMPISCGQTISQPYVVAYMTEQLDVRRDHRVLEIGTGSGYQAAVLSQLAGEVYSVERYRTLADRARETLGRLNYTNVTVVAGDGLSGLPAHAPYDRIIVTAAAEAVPQTLVDELAEGGIMVLPLGEHSGPQRIVRLTRRKEGVTSQELIWVRFVPLLPGQAREL
jgi:protein-L-isoaspartate(D-aspartate) O-methyltransferase